MPGIFNFFRSRPSTEQAFTKTVLSRTQYLLLCYFSYDFLTGGDSRKVAFGLLTALFLEKMYVQSAHIIGENNTANYVKSHYSSLTKFSDSFSTSMQQLGKKFGEAVKSDFEYIKNNI